MNKITIELKNYVLNVNTFYTYTSNDSLIFSHISKFFYKYDKMIKYS